MTIGEFMAIPLRIVPVRGGGRGFGLAVPLFEGEHTLPCWLSPDGKDYWTETIDGVRWRCRYGEADDQST